MEEYRYSTELCCLCNGSAEQYLRLRQEPCREHDAPSCSRTSPCCSLLLAAGGWWTSRRLRTAHAFGGISALGQVASTGVHMLVASIALLMPSNPVGSLPLAATNEPVTKAATAAVTKAAAALRPLATRAVMPVATRVATTRAATVTATPVLMPSALKACTARKASHVWPAPPLTHLAEPTKRHTTLRASFATSCVHPLLHFRLRNREGLHERRLA